MGPLSVTRAVQVGWRAEADRADAVVRGVLEAEQDDSVPFNSGEQAGRPRRDRSPWDGGRGDGATSYADGGDSDPDNAGTSR